MYNRQCHHRRPVVPRMSAEKIAGQNFHSIHVGPHYSQGLPGGRIGGREARQTNRLPAPCVPHHRGHHLVDCCRASCTYHSRVLDLGLHCVGAWQRLQLTKRLKTRNRPRNRDIE